MQYVLVLSLTHKSAHTSQNAALLISRTRARTHTTVGAIIGISFVCSSMLHRVAAGFRVLQCVALLEYFSQPKATHICTALCTTVPHTAPHTAAHNASLARRHTAIHTATHAATHAAAHTATP